MRHERQHLTVHGRNLETEKLRCQSAVHSLGAQVPQIPQLRGMIDVESQISNALQSEVLRHGAENLQLSQQLDRSEEEDAQLQAPFL